MTAPRVTRDGLLTAWDWLGNYEAGSEVTEDDGSTSHRGRPIDRITAEEIDALDEDDAEIVLSLLAVRAWLLAEVKRREEDAHVRAIRKTVRERTGRPVSMAAARETLRRVQALEAG